MARKKIPVNISIRNSSGKSVPNVGVKFTSVDKGSVQKSNQKIRCVLLKVNAMTGAASKTMTGMLSKL